MYPREIATSDSEVHKGLRYTKLRDGFASVSHPDGRVIGFDFPTAEDQVKFEALLGPAGVDVTRGHAKDSNGNYSGFLDQINEGRNVLYFMCVLLHQYEQTALRGSRVKSLALCSKSKRVEPFKKLLLMALVDYFNATNPKSTAEESMARGRPIIENLYKSIMLLPMLYTHTHDITILGRKVPKLTYSEKRVFRASTGTTWKKGYSLSPDIS